MSNYVEMYKNPKYPYQGEEMERLAQQLRENATYEDGIARWKSSKAVIPSDCAEFALFLELPIDVQATNAAREKENEEFIAEYRKNYKGISPEELAEIRAVFGAGEVVVNVLTGDKITL